MAQDSTSNLSQISYAESLRRTAPQERRNPESRRCGIQSPAVCTREGAAGSAAQQANHISKATGPRHGASGGGRRTRCQNFLPEDHSVPPESTPIIIGDPGVTMQHQLIPIKPGDDATSVPTTTTHHLCLARAQIRVGHHISCPQRLANAQQLFSCSTSALTVSTTQQLSFCTAHDATQK